ncbi:MAG: ArsC family reductase [Mariprofundaceae bacterium]|nr:ArsC family reductase [Mariprofundaceae bacterium]
MQPITMYGIPNCNNIKKARDWLDAQHIPFHFHHYKKEGIDANTLQAWCADVGWQVLLNQRGTTWRKLSDAEKADINQDKAIQLMCNAPSMIKRPVLQLENKRIVVGFSAENYQKQLLSGSIA